MQHKDVKNIVRKQIKKEYPNWTRIVKKEKRVIAKMVLEEAVRCYDFSQEVDTPTEELLCIEEQMPAAGIMDLEAMARFIKNHESSKLYSIHKKRSNVYKADEELRVIDNLLDDQIVNKLLSYNGYTPTMRDFFPHQFLRAELLKVIKYPEVSYRKFCSNEYMGIEQKRNRSFIGLALNTNRQISHVQLSQFRSDLGFTQMVNLTVYILHHFMQSGLLGNQVLHAIDSTELASECQRLLATVTIKGKKIRIYNDIDCDCGKRRKKRDKSIYVVGYRVHTLTVINAKTGHSFPLVSLLAPANHHDSNFLVPLVKLAQAIGLDVRLITADEAYHDNEGDLFKETGTYLVTPPKSKVLPPEHFDIETMQVTYDAMCSIPMKYVGVEDKGHEFKCGATLGECPHCGSCSQFRHILIDGGFFQRIPYLTDHVQQALKIRKNAERPFNLLKKREGLEVVRVRSQHGVLARCTFTTIATLLLEIAGTRRKKKPQKKQMKLFANS
jgi:hypothetical protein